MGIEFDIHVSRVPRCKKPNPCGTLRDSKLANRPSASSNLSKKFNLFVGWHSGERGRQSRTVRRRDAAPEPIGTYSRRVRECRPNSQPSIQEQMNDKPHHLSQ